MNTILVVCVGNICRSPVAAAMLKTALPDKKIFSAGLAALSGKPADKLAQQVAAREGIDLSEHRAQQISAWMCEEADLILVMEDRHRRDLERKFPLARGKIRCLGDFEQQGPIDIDDPYRQPLAAFETAHSTIARNVGYWAARIAQLS
ncbi:low molecular weight protein-tyrosine-phosphatase [Paracandidimonas lactea]|jgi:protein-tyrosine phosphatase|uniref:low molecular weight protein-tyrosine-phosphatase n=1 Tax=Paracandidimonas lactea TaxID=2895524 RepID=UPI0019290977|nr:low molecular weight protein-tyrosine-phosphatase [Paracandidimonas lactea]